MASVRKLKPSDPKSPWIVEYTDAAGKRRRKTPKSGLKKDADTLRKQVEQEIERGEHVASRETVTVAEAASVWLEDCRKRARIHDRMTNSTVKMYEACSKRVLQHLGRVRLTDVGRPELQAMIDDLAEKLSPKSVKHTVMCATLLFRHAISNKTARRNPVHDERLRLPREVERSAKIPSREDIAKLLATSSQRWPREHPHAAAVRHAVLCMSLFSTLRRGELCGLHWKDVDFKNGVINVSHSLSRYDGLKTTKTRNGIRKVIIVPQTEAALNALPGDKRPDDFVLTTRAGGPICPIHMSNNYWPVVARKAGLVKSCGRLPLYRLHDMRHTAASLMIDQGLSVLHVKTAMGHASIQTTLNIYGHLFPEDQALGKACRDIAKSFDATETRQS